MLLPSLPILLFLSCLLSEGLLHAMSHSSSWNVGGNHTTRQGAVRGTTPCSLLLQIAVYCQRVGSIPVSVKSPPHKYNTQLWIKNK